MNPDGRRLVVDQLILTFLMPAALPAPAAEAVRRALAGGPFLRSLTRAAVRLLRRDPALRAVVVMTSR